MQQNERCSLIRLKMYLVERIFIMQAIVETLFDTVYLFSVITIGIPSVAVKCVDIRRNTSGEGGLLDDN